MRKKIALVVLLLLSFFSVISITNAYVTVSEYISDCYAAISRSSSGVLTVAIDIRATKTVDVLGAQTIIIQERSPYSTQWTTFATLTSDDYPDMLRYNNSLHDADISYPGAKPDYFYRAKVYFYSEKGGYDTYEFITSSV